MAVGISEKGKYINPDRSLPWNNLPMLPPLREFYRDVEFMEILGETKAILAVLHGRSIVLPNPAILINTISMREAKASSEIENVFTTDDELYKAFSENQQEEPVGPAKEVLRYREALWKGHNYLEEKEAFDRDYFVEMYREVKQATDGIRPEHAKVYIRQEGSGPNSGKTVYTPPRGTKVLNDCLTNLLDYLNDDEKFKEDHLVKMAIAHYQFEAIHPFRDGNGRVGRILNIHYLTSKGLLEHPILYLSKYILENRNDYYAGIRGVSQHAAWRKWIIFMLNAVRDTAGVTFRQINDIVDTRDSILQAIKMQTKIQRPEKLVEMIFWQPFAKVKHFTDAKIYAENTARNYLNRLCEMSILEKKTIEGHHYYLNIDLHRVVTS